MCIKRIFCRKSRSNLDEQVNKTEEINPAALVHLFNKEAEKINPNTVPGEQELLSLLEQSVDDCRLAKDSNEIDFSGLDPMQRWKKKARLNAAVLLFPVLEAALERPVEASELKMRLGRQAFPFPDCLRFIGVEKTGVSGLAYTALGPANLRLLLLSTAKYRGRPLGWSPGAEVFIRAIQENPEKQFYFVNPNYRQLVKDVLKKYHELSDPR